jgi:hypothetical protein
MIDLIKTLLGLLTPAPGSARCSSDIVNDPVGLRERRYLRNPTCRWM